MGRPSLLSFVVLVALGGRALVHAEADGVNPSIATVDMKQIFAAHPKTKESEAQINAERNTAKKVLDDGEAKISQLRMDIRELDGELAGGKLGDTAREQTVTICKEKAAQLQIMEAQMRALREESMKELRATSIRMRDAILDGINADVGRTPELAPAMLLLDKSGPSMNAVPFVLYSSTRLDLSGAVQKQIGIEGAESAKDAGAGQGLVVAIVDMKRVFDGYSRTREAGEKINEARSAAAREFEERLAPLKTLAETIRKLDEQLADPALSETERRARTPERSARGIEAQAMEQDLTEFRQTREKQIQEQYVRMRDTIADDINRAITEGVKAEGRVDLVFDASGTSLRGTQILLRHQGLADWTEALLAKLNSAGKSGTNRVPVKWEGGTASTAKLRFAVVDLERVIESLPATKAADEAVEQARAAAKVDVENGADAKAKQEALENLAATKRAEIVEGVKKQVLASAVKSSCQVVFDSSGHSLNGVPVVKVLKGVPDLSEEVIAAMGGATR